MAKITIDRKEWTDQYGHYHPASTYQMEDSKPKVRWKKEMDEDERRALVLEAHKGDLLASARWCQALANATTDAETKVEAEKDADSFVDEYAKRKVGGT